MSLPMYVHAVAISSGGFLYPVLHCMNQATLTYKRIKKKRTKRMGTKIHFRRRFRD